MIKNLKKMFVLLLFLVIPNVVLADDDDYSHILSIEKFDINDSKITIEGYSFISHQDNYGIMSDGIGNLKTYLMVYTGSWNNEWLDPDKCDASSNCYSKLTTSVERDMWAARCTDIGCVYHDDVKKYRLANGFVNNNTCDNGTISYNGKTITDVECLYENVGFSVKIDLQTIVDVFSNGNDSVYENGIKFMIVSVNIGNNPGVKVVNSELNVYRKVCSVSGSTSACGDTVKTGNFEFKFDGFSDTVLLEAHTAMPRDALGVKVQNKSYFKYGVNYKILNINTKKELVKTINADSNYKGIYYDSIIQLDSILSSAESYDSFYGVSTLYGKTSMIVPASDGDVGGTDVDFWALTNHVVTMGSLTITSFKPVGVSLECGEVDGFVSDSDKKVTASVECGGDPGVYNQCVKLKKVGSNSNNDAVFYVKSSEQTDNCSANKVKINDVWYFPVNVSTDILINQSATFTFGNVTPGTVYAGKGFSLGKTTYESTISWINANKTWDGLPYYKYEYNDEVLSGGVCVKTTPDIIGDSVTYYYKQDNNYRNILFGSNSEWESSTDIYYVSYYVIRTSVDNYIDSSAIDNISFLSCDSNGNNSYSCATNPNVSVSGSWASNNVGWSWKVISDGSRNVGSVKEKSYEYKLANSYIQVSGDDAGKAKYIKDVESKIEGLIATGNKFYIDFKWFSDTKWPFNLTKNINPSFINSMTWTLNGTCGIDVNDSYYRVVKKDSNCKTGSCDTNVSLLYKYRSISLSNPFPKATTGSDSIDYSKIAVNWQSWYGSSSNQNRISKAYDNLNYEVTINKIDDGKTDTISIADINSITSNYGELSNFKDDGTSDFVSNNFGTINVVVGKNYCGLGFFATSCNQV